MWKDQLCMDFSVVISDMSFTSLLLTILKRFYSSLLFSKVAECYYGYKDMFILCRTCNISSVLAATIAGFLISLKHHHQPPLAVEEMASYSPTL